MNRARILVLLMAIAAGGLAIKLVSSMTDRPPPAEAPDVAPPQIETIEVLAAAAEIRPGELFSGQNIAWQTWPAGSAAAADFITRSIRPAALQELSGARARTAFAPGEPIRLAGVAKPGSGFLAAILNKGVRAVALEITPENSAGSFILPGDHVDVILTRTPAKAEDNYLSETIIWNVRVLAIDQIIEDKTQRTTAAGRIATLELTPPQAETLALARRLGTVSLALRGIDDFAGGSEDSAALGRRDGINIVRYGVGTMTLR
jgi:pilus assembly protein CpaB